MEQFNNTVCHEDDHDIYFGDNPVAESVPMCQARNVPGIFPVIPSVLTDAQVLLGYQVDADSSSPYNESDPISKMLRNLEKSVINEKDEEISVLKSELEEKNKEIVINNEKMAKLVDYITFVHGEFGKLLRGMMIMEIKDETNILCLGPFKNGTAKTEFIQNLIGLSTNFLSDFENLTRTKELFEKINMILKSRETVTNKQSANNISNGNTNQIHSSVQQINGGINYASSFNQAIPMPPPSNIRSSPPTSCRTNTDMPPPVSSTHEIPPPANLTEYTEYPVLSIQEAPPPPNFMIPTLPPPSSSNMTIEPPPSPLNLTMRRPPPSISRNSLQADYGINLASANKKHGIDHSKGKWGFFCLCNTRFNSSGKLKDHIQYFTMKNLECIICKKRYHKPCLLKLHMISSHKLEYLDNGMLTCSLCQRNFRNWNEFREHLQKNHGIEERHTTVRQNNVAQGSPKHARDVSTEIPHGCICGKKYGHKSALVLHINTKLYGKIFKCGWCTSAFYTHTEMKSHVSKFHGVGQDKQNKYGCAMCGETFVRLTVLRKHRSDVHPKVRESA